MFNTQFGFPGRLVIYNSPLGLSWFIETHFNRGCTSFMFMLAIMAYTLWDDFLKNSGVLIYCKNGKGGISCVHALGKLGFCMLHFFFYFLKFHSPPRPRAVPSLNLLLATDFCVGYGIELPRLNRKTLEFSQRFQHLFPKCLHPRFASTPRMQTRKKVEKCKC